MVKRRNRNRKRRGRRGALLPGSTNRLVYTGTLDAGQTTALSYTTVAYSDYRVAYGIISVSGIGGPSNVQFSLRGEGGEDDSAITPIINIGVTTRTLRLAQGRGVSFADWGAASNHVAWIRSSGPTKISYVATVVVVRRETVNIASLVDNEILPDFERLRMS